MNLSQERLQNVWRNEWMDGWTNKCMNDCSWRAYKHNIDTVSLQKDTRVNPGDLRTKLILSGMSEYQESWNISLFLNTLRTGDADLRFYITTVQDGWRKSAFLTRACFPCTIHLIMQYIEPVSEWFCWRMFIETWPHSELTFRHRASSI